MLKKIKRFIAPAVTLIALFVIFKNLDILPVIDAFKNSDKIVLFTSSAVALIGVIASLSWRLKETMSMLGCNLKYKEALKIYLAVLPASKLSPANAGDFIRSYYFKDQISPSITAGTVFFERLLDIIVISIMAIFSGAIIGSKISVLFGGLGLFASCLLFFLFKVSFFWKNKSDKKRKFLDKLEKTSIVFKTCVKNKRSFSKIIFYTFSNWLIVMFYMAFIFYSLGSKVPILSIVSAQPLVSYASFIPITISGMGARESAMLFLYKDIAPVHITLSSGLFFSLFSALLLPLTGVPLMYRIIKKDRYGK